MSEKKTVKIVTIITSIILVLTALFAVTYALLTGETIAEDPNSYKTGLLAITATSKTENISLASTIPMSDEDGINTEPYIFTITNVGNLDYRFDLKLLSTGDSSSDTVISPSFIKLQIDDGDVTTLSSSRGIIKENITLKAGESIDVKLRAWLSIDTTNDQIGRIFTSKIVADGQAIYTDTNSDITLAAHITRLYTPNDTATNNGLVYNLDSSDQIMKDIAGNLRYYGANTTYDEDGTTVTNKLKNYIYFNCDTYPDNNCETWRIIGVFGNLVKLIRASSIDDLSWDYDYNNDLSSQTYNNNWKNSSLRELLNGEYMNNENTEYYNYTTNGAAKKLLNFNTDKTGIKDSTRNLIAEVSYNLGGFKDSAEMYPNEIYRLELEGAGFDETYDSTLIDKIALPYASDYAYATNFKSCNYPLNNYNNTDCMNYNWMQTIFSNASFNWLLNRNTLSSTKVSAVTQNGTIEYDVEANNESNTMVTPILYLNSTVIIHSGDGSASDPYRIIIEQ